jgi:phage terminase small subunit
MADALNDRQRRFVEAYLIEPNGKQAAIAAGYSRETAESQASRLLSLAKVRAELDRLRGERAQRTAITADEVLKELKRIAMCDIGEAFDDATGVLKPLNQIPVDVRRCIASIEVDELFDYEGGQRTRIGVTKKVRFWDKKGSLDSLGKHLKLFTDKVELSGKVTLEQLVLASIQTDGDDEEG